MHIEVIQGDIRTYQGIKYEVEFEGHRFILKSLDKNPGHAVFTINEEIATFTELLGNKFENPKLLK
jgi:hypothetical protein